MDRGGRGSRHVVAIDMDGKYPDVREVSARARTSAEALTASGTAVRFVRTVYVPEDGACLLIFESPTADAALSAARSAGLPVSQVSTALTIDDA